LEQISEAVKISAGCQRLVEDYENLTMPLSSLLSETEILKFLLHCRTVSSYRISNNSGCAFLPAQHSPLSLVSSKTIGKSEICEYLNVWNLETILANIVSLAFPFSLNFAGSTCWLRKIRKKCSRGFRLRARNFKEAIIYQTTMEETWRDSSSVSIIEKKQKLFLKNNVWQRTLFKKEKKEEFNKYN